MQPPIAATPKADVPTVQLDSPSRARSRRSRLLPLAGVLILGIGLGVAGADLAADPVSPEVAVAIESNGSLDASQIGEGVIPSVVTVEVTGPSGAGSGSGVVYDDQGNILTNHHVVARGSAYRVVLSDGRVYPAVLLGSDASTDLAVLQVTAQDLPALGLGSTSLLNVGDRAVAVGSPLGLDGGPSLSVGVISAMGREVQTGPDVLLYGMLQTDAPITQGSSGGALVDEAGRLIGITTAVGVSSVGVEGIGFATPVEIVERVADEIIAGGGASQPFLGVSGSTAFGPTLDGGERPIGVTVSAVNAGSPALAAGLAIGDTITAIDGVPVETMDDLIAQLRRYPAGETVTLGVVRNTGASAAHVVLGDRA